jgi:dTDP-4-amino-4,6-dideoxygalactose transaminase/predicted O-linked N-acetylglucosamine transferase (SPINDLY family)
MSLQARLPEVGKEGEMQQTPPAKLKPGRNDRCPCGSLKKYKNCCASKLAAQPALGPVRSGAEAASPNRKALGKEPSAAESSRIMALVVAGRFAEAENQARLLMARYPNSGFLWKVLGAALHKQGKEAVPALQKSVELMPDDAEAHYNLGTVFKAIGQTRPAVMSFARALEINPNHGDAYNNLGDALSRFGQLDGAIACYRRALEIRPDWAGVYSNLLFALCHHEATDAATLFAEHLRYAELFEAPLRAAWAEHANSRDADRVLQIGFVSADLFNHAVAPFIEPVFAELSSSTQVSLHVYYNNDTEDAVTQRLRGYVRHWRPVAGLSDEALAQRICDDGIDVLIDLSGHTSNNRLPVFARKPAPVQASWIGYPETTGLRAMDYYLADHVFLPHERFAGQFTEQLAYLPAAVAFMPAPEAPAVNALPALSRGYITFGSFNRPSKINRSVIARWAQLLRALPDARMLMGGIPQGGEGDTLIKCFAQEGIAQERLSFHARCDTEAYLSLHHQVDLCLDTFPYNGGTTTLYALWMGVPTLVMTGSTAASRAGASSLSQVGLEAFVAHDSEEFVQKGLYWAGNLAALSDIRAGLRQRFADSVMAQPQLFAASLQQALRIMWRRWCAGLPAQSFEVTQQEIADASPQPSQAEPQPASPIYVTQPLLPPLAEFLPYLQQIWDSKWLTNNGPFHQQLEQALRDYLGVKHVALFTSGTVALITALQALRISGEVITTPYSFVATAHSLLWNGIKPVFVDIDPITLNLDPGRIEEAINPQTTAIMPVHCYGHPCDVERIAKIADNYGLKVIYDAAQAFGVRCQDGSVLNYGDLSVLSFHATKVFNTFEGGAIVCHDAKTKQRIDHLKNFGFVDEVTVVASGINGKMSEINAAFGLLQLKGIDEALQKRSVVDARYRRALAGIKGIHCLSASRGSGSNHAYFPILVQPDYPLSRDALYNKMREHGIFGRRYFYPLISDFPMYRGMPSAVSTNLPVAKKVADQVICLPMHPALTNEQVASIAAVIAC